MTRPANFIASFKDALSGTEVPELYAIWTGIAGVSALLARRCWLNAGRMKLYPNLCIVLIAESGQHKSTPIVILQEEVFNKMPSESRPNLIAQEITPQRLVQAMTRASSVNNYGEFSSGFGLFEELGTFLAQGSYDGALPALLIKLIDCSTYEKETIGRGIESIPNPCFGFIGGTTIEYLRRAIPEGAIGEGLTSRFIFVHVEGRTGPVPFPPEIEGTTLSELSAEAERLLTIRGEITYDETVFAEHVIEYKRFYEKSPFWSNPSLRGYARRRDKHLLKLAMIFAIASHSDRIYIGHYQAALSLIYRSENILQRMTQKITSTAEGSRTELVLEIISRSSMISRRALPSQVSHILNSRDLGEILSTLRDTGQIAIEANGRDVYLKVLK